MSDHETEQLQWVFGWTGGEGQSEAWQDEHGREIARAGLWMEDAPDYLGDRDLPRPRHSPGTYYRTVIAYMRETVEAAGWKQVARYSSSGERDCGCSEAERRDDPDHETGEPWPDCILCEGEGTVYVGEGWTEHVLVATATVELPPLGLGPGKYSSRIERALDSLALDGGGDDETGDVEGPGHYILLQSDDLDSSRIERWMHADTPDEADVYLLTPDEREQLVEAKGGAILCTNSDGFVSVELFTTREEILSAWGEIERECAEFYADDDASEF